MSEQIQIQELQSFARSQTFSSQNQQNQLKSDTISLIHDSLKNIRECTFQILVNSSEEANLDVGRRSKTLFKTIYKILKQGSLFLEDWNEEMELIVENIEEFAEDMEENSFNQVPYETNTVLQAFELVQKYDPEIINFEDCDVQYLLEESKRIKKEKKEQLKQIYIEQNISDNIEDSFEQINMNPSKADFNKESLNRISFQNKVKKSRIFQPGSLINLAKQTSSLRKSQNFQNQQDKTIQKQYLNNLKGIDNPNYDPLNKPLYQPGTFYMKEFLVCTLKLYLSWIIYFQYEKNNTSLLFYLKQGDQIVQQLQDQTNPDILQLVVQFQFRRGNIYFASKKLDQALEFYQQAYDFSHKELLLRTKLYQNFCEKNVNSALLIQAKTENIIKIMTITLQQMSQIYDYKGEYYSVLETLKLAYWISKNYLPEEYSELFTNIKSQYKDQKKKYQNYIMEQKEIRHILQGALGINILDAILDKNMKEDEKLNDGENQQNEQDFTNYFNKLMYEKYNYEQINQNSVFVVRDKNKILEQNQKDKTAGQKNKRYSFMVRNNQTNQNNQSNKNGLKINTQEDIEEQAAEYYEQDQIQEKSLIQDQNLDQNSQNVSEGSLNSQKNFQKSNKKSEDQKIDQQNVSQEQEYNEEQQKKQIIEELQESNKTPQNVKKENNWELNSTVQSTNQTQASTFRVVSKFNKNNNTTTNNNISTDNQSKAMSFTQVLENNSIYCSSSNRKLFSTTHKVQSKQEGQQKQHTKSQNLNKNIYNNESVKLNKQHNTSSVPKLIQNNQKDKKGENQEKQNIYQLSQNSGSFQKSKSQFNLNLKGNFSQRNLKSSQNLNGQIQSQKNSLQLPVANNYEISGIIMPSSKEINSSQNFEQQQQQLNLQQRQQTGLNLGNDKNGEQNRVLQAKIFYSQLSKKSVLKNRNSQHKKFSQANNLLEEDEEAELPQPKCLTTQKYWNVKEQKFYSESDGKKQTTNMYVNDVLEDGENSYSNFIQRKKQLEIQMQKNQDDPYFMEKLEKFQAKEARKKKMEKMRKQEYLNSMDGQMENLILESLQNGQNTLNYRYVQKGMENLQNDESFDKNEFSFSKNQLIFQKKYSGKKQQPMFQKGQTVQKIQLEKNMLDFDYQTQGLLKAQMRQKEVYDSKKAQNLQRIQQQEYKFIGKSEQDQTFVNQQQQKNRNQEVIQKSRNFNNTPKDSIIKGKNSEFMQGLVKFQNKMDSQSTLNTPQNKNFQQIQVGNQNNMVSKRQSNVQRKYSSMSTDLDGEEQEVRNPEYYKEYAKSIINNMIEDLDNEMIEQNEEIFERLHPKLTKDQLKQKQKDQLDEGKKSFLSEFQHLCYSTKGLGTKKQMGKQQLIQNLSELPIANQRQRYGNKVQMFTSFNYQISEQPFRYFLKQSKAPFSLVHSHETKICAGNLFCQLKLQDGSVIRELEEMIIFFDQEIIPKSQFKNIIAKSFLSQEISQNLRKLVEYLSQTKEHSQFDFEKFNQEQEQLLQKLIDIKKQEKETRFSIADILFYFTLKLVLQIANQNQEVLSSFLRHFIIDLEIDTDMNKIIFSQDLILSPYLPVEWLPSVNVEIRNNLQKNLPSIIDFAEQVGAQYKYIARNQLENQNILVTQHVPFSPKPIRLNKRDLDDFQQKGFLWNKLLSKMANDTDFILETFKSMTDPFVVKQLEILKKVQECKFANQTNVILTRNDVMHDAKSECWKQVEFNTYATSLHRMSSTVQELQSIVKASFLKNQLGNFDQKVEKPDQVVSETIFKAHQLYGKENAIVVMVVLEVERNIFDQRIIEIELIKLGVQVVRKTFQELYGELKRNQEGVLFLEGQEISVVYYRSGFTLEQFPNEECWQAKEMIECSQALKCPNIRLSLTNLKKAQQALQKDDILRRFVESDEEMEKIKKNFVEIIDFEDESKQELIILKVKSEISDWVLKPQREGGANNYYDEEILDQLNKMSVSERKNYILMKKIKPQPVVGFMVKESKLHVAPVISEVGVYGGYVADQKQEYLNINRGYLCRTKMIYDNEGGLASGVAVIDSIMHPKE
ncbi:Pre-ATP-grasp domain [Pseudocohnilembus persalinus]|uniref:glutathione synthase n=1 Tax=Pseudocohnilembus persalinus TaxID=266149 RepID=A0A0V0R9J6_PSEPJ|nr:Pre-ATP-grasp domain [Pseudocohnilembus persalinus]|eukprot:KRX10888.1 Pre-ATP-grasp domain [Pseudocohnilembus persalinus]